VRGYLSLVQRKAGRYRCDPSTKATETIFSNFSDAGHLQFGSPPHPIAPAKGIA